MHVVDVKFVKCLSTLHGYVTVRGARPWILHGSRISCPTQNLWVSAIRVPTAGSRSQKTRRNVTSLCILKLGPLKHKVAGSCPRYILGTYPPQMVPRDLNIGDSPGFGGLIQGQIYNPESISSSGFGLAKRRRYIYIYMELDTPKWV